MRQTRPRHCLSLHPLNVLLYKGAVQSLGKHRFESGTQIPLLHAVRAWTWRCSLSQPEPDAPSSSLTAALGPLLIEARRTYRRLPLANDDLLLTGVRLPQAEMNHDGWGRRWFEGTCSFISI